MLERERLRRVVDELYSMTTEPQAEKYDLEEAQRVREKLSAQQAEQESITQNGSDVQLLADALRRFGKLPRLAVEAFLDQGSGKHAAAAPQGESQRVWVRATQVYRTVTLAIAHSGAAIQSLQIYKDSKTKSCGMSTWDINEHMPALESTTFVQAAQHIKSLSLSFSIRIETNHQKIADVRAKTSAVDHAYRSDYEAGRGMGQLSDLLSESDPSAVAAEDYPGFARLLKQTPNLEHLELHQRGIRCNNATYARVVVSCIFDNVVLPSLRHCTVRVPFCDEVSLLKFIRLHKALDTLELLHSDLVSGSWNPVFSQLCDMPLLQQVTLSNIRTPGKYGVMNLTSPLHSKEEREALISDGENCSRYGGGMKVHTRLISRDQMLRERFVFEDWADPFPDLDARQAIYGFS